MALDSSSSDPCLARLDTLLSCARHATEDTRHLVRSLHAESRLSLSRLEAAAAASALSAPLAVGLAFKVVAEVETARFVSIFDGVTQFRIGEKSTRHRMPGRRGAFFVHSTLRGACAQSFPADAKLLHAPRAVLLVRCEGGEHTPAHGSKRMHSGIEPLRVVARLSKPGSSRWQLMERVPIAAATATAAAKRTRSDTRREPSHHHQHHAFPARCQSQQRRTRGLAAGPVAGRQQLSSAPSFWRRPTGVYPT